MKQLNDEVWQKTIEDNGIWIHSFLKCFLHQLALAAIVYLMEKFIIRVQNFLIILLSRHMTCGKLRDWTNIIIRLQMLVHLWEI